MKNRESNFKRNLEYVRQYQEALKSGDKQASDAALEKIIQVNRGLVRSIANKWVGRSSHDGEDLYIEGVTGLMKAAKAFDLSRNNEFSTYATHKIRKAIQVAVIDDGSFIRVPRNQYYLLNRIKKAINELAQSLQREPTMEELCKAVGVPAKTIDTLLMTENVVSLHRPLNGEDGDPMYLADFIDDPSSFDAFDAVEGRDIVRKVLGLLTINEREMVAKRFVQNCTVKETAQSMGCNPNDVRFLTNSFRRKGSQYLSAN